MGRGRAKAKQTKVARGLKYNTHGIDPDALLAELAGRPSNGTAPQAPAEDELEDPYAKYVDPEDLDADADDPDAED